MIRVPNLPRAFPLAVLCGGLLLLAGCRSSGPGSCRQEHPYSAAQNLPPLHIPVGLDGPDTRAAVRIPELGEPEVPRSSKDPCLEEPPKFDTASSTRPTR